MEAELRIMGSETLLLLILPNQNFITFVKQTFSVVHLLW